MHLSELIPIIQIAVGPVILISGVGLVLLSMTNRLGRVIDRARSLVDALRKLQQPDDGRISGQLKILARRARLLQAAISCAVTSVLMAAVLIILLFVSAFLKWEIALLIAALFVACMGALIFSLLLFLWDVRETLRAMNLEIQSEEKTASARLLKRETKSSPKH